MKNIFITGISGYLGGRLVEALKKSRDIGEIVGVDVQPPKKEKNGYYFYQADIRDPNMGELILKHKIDTILHLAFVVKPIHNKKRMHAIDYDGTLNVLQSSLTAGVKHVVTISSTLAYGAHKDNPDLLTEDAPLRGNKTYPYGYYKALVEEMVRDFAALHPEMPVTILRPCTVFGPSVDNYVSRMLFMPATTCVAGCNPEVQFLHEEDFVRACLTALEKKKAGAYNIVGEGTLPIREIAKILGTKIVPLPAWLLYPMLEILWQLHFPRIEVNRGYLDYVRYPFIASPGKAKSELNFFPKYTSVETLEDTLRSRHRV